MSTEVSMQYDELYRYFQENDMVYSSKALIYAKEKHSGTFRENQALPYIIHPMNMATLALITGLREDELIAIILLHDVTEETGEAIDSTFSERIKSCVEKLTLCPGVHSNICEYKVDYFRELIFDPFLVICKGLDRYDNLSSMVGNLSEIRIKKNVIETNQLLLPMLRIAKKLYPNYSQIELIERIIKTQNDVLAKLYNIEFKQPGELAFAKLVPYKNPYQ